MLSVLRRSARHPTRFALTLLQVVVGAFVVALALTLLSARQQGDVDAQTFRLQAGSRDEQTGSGMFYQLFRLADLPRLRQLSPDVQVLDVMEEEFGGHFEVRGKRYRYATGKRTGADLPRVLGLPVLHGTFFSPADVEKGRKVVVLSETVARTLFGRSNAVGQILGISGFQGGAVPHRVIGVTPDSTGYSSPISPFYLPIESSRAAGNPFVGRASALLVRARPGRVNEAKAQLLAAARQLYKDDQAFKSNKRALYAAEADDVMRFGPDVSLIVLSAVAAITFAVSALGIFANLMVSTQEQARAISLRRALGASRTRVLGEVLSEALLVSLIGAVIGLALAWLLAPVLTAPLRADVGLVSRGVPLTVGVAAEVLLAVLVAGVLFGLYPGWRASQGRPAEVLRGAA